MCKGHGGTKFTLLPQNETLPPLLPFLAPERESLGPAQTFCPTQLHTLQGRANLWWGHSSQSRKSQGWVLCCSRATHSHVVSTSKDTHTQGRASHHVPAHEVGGPAVPQLCPTAMAEPFPRTCVSIPACNRDSSSTFYHTRSALTLTWHFSELPGFSHQSRRGTQTWEWPVQLKQGKAAQRSCL